MKTRAARALGDWLKEDKSRSCTKLADTLGISHVAVFAWRDGKARPATRHRDALQKLTGVPAADWETPKERAAREQLDARVEAAARTGTGG